MSDKTQKKRKEIEKEKQDEVLKKVKLSKQRMETIKPPQPPKQNSTLPENEESLQKRKATKANLEKKREKNRLNKLRKRQQKRGEVKADPKTQENAINYLNLWKTDKESWKFMKIRQTWLLKNMYKSILISDDDFDTLLFYIDSIKGNSREKTLKHAETMIKDIDKKWSENDTKDEYDVSLYERARKVVQLL